MCGIVGYIGPHQASDVLLSGLQRLEYRGYDSAGVAIFSGEKLQLRRAVGKLINLSRALKAEPAPGQVGIGHTRWATHGRPSEANAHPHRVGEVTVVHNGIIENHTELRAELQMAGAEFSSETDSEIFAHLIAREVEKGVALFDAMNSALSRVHGSYALVVFSAAHPDQLVAARQGSPMVIGEGEGENFLASDVAAILSYTRRVRFLEEGDRVRMSAGAVEIFDAAGASVERPLREINWSPAQAEKGGYKHFMLKEIFEQPAAVGDTLSGRLRSDRPLLEELNLSDERLQKLRRVQICACGTAWHAGLVGRRFLEELLRIPVTVDLASEFRYQMPVVDEETLFIVVSQSGETADSYAALLEAKRLGAWSVSVCNVLESSIARNSDAVLYTHAGPEISVASTKAFVTQLAALKLLALALAERLGRLSAEARQAELEALAQLPRFLQRGLEERDAIRVVARQLTSARHCLFLGRGAMHPIALEGALKLKEISYIHAEGYAAGEMKHGPIALIDEEMPVVVIIPRDQHYEKSLSNLQEVRARGGRVIAIGTAGDEGLRTQAETCLWIPEAPEALLPFLATLPLQLLAYDVADLKGTDVDQPRNLAKSVTVE
ncbi:MAG: glutamine--fructose-6-phosphate transaminase (isomerizing) [Myxococcota bacterium]|nr:glutamine--fructose-6-phosphate transaminase (isomerizing) [Myxococcota bacterium]